MPGVLATFEKRMILYPLNWGNPGMVTLAIYFTKANYEKHLEDVRSLGPTERIPSLDEYAEGAFQAFGQVCTKSRATSQMNRRLLELALETNSCMIQAHEVFDNNTEWTIDTPLGDEPVEEVVREALDFHNLVYLNVCNQYGQDISVRRGQVVYPTGTFGGAQKFSLKHVKAPR